MPTPTALEKIVARVINSLETELWRTIAGFEERNEVVVQCIELGRDDSGLVSVTVVLE